MDFDTLQETIPYVTGGKEHLLTYQPYNGITLRLPGRHSMDTDPLGGDFVVCVDDANLNWISHQFTHENIFLDIEKKTQQDEKLAQSLMNDYAWIVYGGDPEKCGWERGVWNDTLHPQTFLYAVQCLAVAEHRRYHKFEAKGGGRYLPARFASGIVEGKWAARDCIGMQRRGRPGVEILEKVHGKPIRLKELANA